MTVAVVVPTYGRGAVLRRCLASLAALDPAPDRVFLVDGNEEVRDPCVGVPNLEVVAEPNRGAAHARNTGYRAARDAGADVVCFIDDDAVAPTDWVGRHLDLHRRHPDAGAVGGGCTNLAQGNLVADFTHRVIFRPLRGDAGPVRFLLTLNASFKAACLDQVGLFDESISAAGGEDVELGWRIVKAGWPVWYEPGLTVGHHYPTTWSALVRQQKAYGRGFVAARWAWPDLPGAELLRLPWPRAVAGTAPHLWREARSAAGAGGPRLIAPSLVRESVFRAAALGERRRRERAADPAGRA